jgi:hypothetical protein
VDRGNGESKVSSELLIRPLEQLMTKNVGGIDRLLRAEIGLTLIGLAARALVAGGAGRVWCRC